MPCGVKAPCQICTMAVGNCPKLTARTTRANTIYNTAMKGTSLEVVLAMLLIPPTITRPTITAITRPSIHALSLEEAGAASSHVNHNGDSLIGLEHVTDTKAAHHHRGGVKYPQRMA